LLRKKNIGVFGIGAIGTVVAYQLGCNTPHQLYYFNRSERTDLRLVLPNQQTVSKPIKCNTVADTPLLDWLFVCLKAHQMEVAIPQLDALIGADTLIVVIRNGLKHRDDWTAAGLTHRVLPALIDCPTQLNADGYYEQLRPARLTAPKSEAGSNLAKLIASTQLKLELTIDFKTASWLKLAESAALGAVTCLAGAGCWVFEDGRMLAFYQSLLEETVKVALADGAHIPPDFIAELTTKVKQYPPHKTSSMLADRLAGKPIELSAKNGIISELAKTYQIATPLNDLVCTLLDKVNKKR
jgi:2-dehydropantoate 2-reductase